MVGYWVDRGMVELGPKIPKYVRPKEPKPKPIRVCRYCSALAVPSRPHCAGQDCKRQYGRDRAKHQRATRTPKWQENRRKGWRTRRAMRRGVVAEKYGLVEIADRDHWRCGLCGKRIRKGLHYLDPMALTIDHLIPLSLGGDDVKANVQAAHRHCNVVKGTRAAGEQLRFI